MIDESWQAVNLVDCDIDIVKEAKRNVWAALSIVIGQPFSP